MHSSSRPPTTYARRKLRVKQQYAVENVNLQTSPLEQLSPSVQDITLSEMSRRMKKPSRLVLTGSSESLERQQTKPDLKKSKANGCYGGQSLEASVPSTPCTSPDCPLFPLPNQQIEESIFSTPDMPSKTDQYNSRLSAPVTQDELSPIPVARRMLSRMSSRNLKENSGRGGGRVLASPFSSRPGSRPSSPPHTVQQKSRPGSHVKARTLSSDLDEKIKTKLEVKITQPATFEFDSILNDTYPTSAPVSVAPATNHTRAASIPTCVPSLLDNVSLQSWLVPPRALLRSTDLFDDIHLDTFQAQHPSFYLDVPTKISTPPRKRSATITQRSFAAEQLQGGEQSASHQTTIEPGEDATLTGTDYAGPRQPRRRRRTVVHMSSDSIFSSALDFSAYSTDFTQTKRLGLPLPARTASSFLACAPDLAAPVPILDPAFSPITSHTPHEDTEEDMCPTAPTSPVSAPHLDLPSVIANTPSVRISPFLRRSHSLPTRPNATINELHDAFVALQLNNESESCTLNPHDSSVEMQEPSSTHNASVTSSRCTDQVQKRRRGDTLRASDFFRPSLSINDSSSDSRVTSPALPSSLNTTRRTRSGTVTISDARSGPAQSYPIEVLVTDAPGVQKGLPKAKSRSRGMGRSRYGHARAQATIIMKIDDEPLPPQGSDEEDDELLLTGQKWEDPPEDD